MAWKKSRSGGSRGASTGLEKTVDLYELHQGQVEILETCGRRNVLACGRRFGKTTLGIELAFWPAHDGYPVGYFVPEYKLLTEVWEEMCDIFGPIVRPDQQQKRLEFSTGGVIECWSFDRNPNAGRSRKYKRIVVDEAAHCRNLRRTWTKGLRPTLTDFKGDAWFLSSPNGLDYFHTLFTYGQDGRKGWASWQRTSYDNPHLDPAEIDEARDDLPPEAFDQEYLAKFLADVFGRLVNDEWLDVAYKAERPERAGRCSIGVDLGEGTGRDHTAFCVLDEFGIVHFESSNTVDIPHAAKRLSELAQRFNVPDDRIAFDAGGRGKDLPNYLAQYRLDPRPYHGGAPQKGKWANRRSRAGMKLRHRLDPGRLAEVDHGAKSDSPWKADRPGSVKLQPPFALPADRPWWPRLREEIAALRYEVAGGKFALEKKDDLMAKLGRSPDFVDALLVALSTQDLA
jgi:hypothetical protein